MHAYFTSLKQIRNRGGSHYRQYENITRPRFTDYFPFGERSATCLPGPPEQ